jgi:hypothetical protein
MCQESGIETTSILNNVPGTHDHGWGGSRGAKHCASKFASFRLVEFQTRKARVVQEEVAKRGEVRLVEFQTRKNLPRGEVADSLCVKECVQLVPVCVADELLNLFERHRAQL